MAPAALQSVLSVAGGVALGAGGAVLAELCFKWSQLLSKSNKKEEGDAEGFSLKRQSLAVASTLQTSRRDNIPLDRAAVLKTFISLVPKAELHLHIEGTLEPRQMLDLARRNGLPAPYPSEDAARQAYHFQDLQSFLDLYYNGCSVLRTSEDFYDLTMAYLLRAASAHIKHVEFFFDPQTHLANGVDFDVFMPGFIKAAKDGKVLGVNVLLIMCFLRHLSEDSAFDTLAKAEPWMKHVVAVGLDSSELNNPPGKFEKVMAKVRQMGLPVVAHAGEEGPPDYVWDALNLLKVARVDHGVRSLDDPKLMKHLAEHKIPLTVCPLSNLKLKVWDGVLVPKLKQLIVGTGLAITINSDDPAYFDGYINENFEWVAKELELSVSQVAELAANSFQASFISQEDKDVYIAQIKELEKAWVAIEDLCSS